MSPTGMGQAAGGPAAAGIPAGLGIAAAIVFLLIAASHLQHMLASRGQRRPWHASHVLMALGMVFMYAPRSLNPIEIPVGFWELVFACAGLFAAVWSLSGGERTTVLLWMLTAIDLGAMFYMWSASQLRAPLSWLLVGYFVADACMWGVDAYRRLEGSPPLLSWALLPGAGGEVAVGAGAGAGARSGMPGRVRGGTPGRSPRAGDGSGPSGRAVSGAGSGSLIGEMNISASMIAMSLGMAYMFAVTQMVI